MTSLPTGTVTFLFTDLEGSTRLWEEQPEAMQPALARHDEIVRGAIETHGGAVVKTTGDGAHAAFATAHDAVAAAVDAQVRLRSAAWETAEPLVVRMGLHSGEVELRDGDYYGSAVNRAARLMSVAHGGQVLVSAATAELVREGRVELVDLGEHRLRDLGHPEHVFQVAHPDLPRAFPPLQSVDGLPGNLPLQPNPFVGRAALIRQVTDLVAEAAVVTLTGPGGVGKTRLALEVAVGLQPEYPDGAWFVDLAPIATPERVGEALLETLGYTLAAGEDAVAGLCSRLRRRRVLLVIDNCEHLVAPVATVVEAIAASAPGVRVVATSREGLGVPAERVVPVGPLATDADGDAVDLFITRARAVRPDFAPDAATRATVIELCRRLDGIPLAIELAVARTRSMAPAMILDRLDERFRVLTGGSRTAVARHQTLQAAVDWSYDLLADAERRVFDRLSVFPGGFPLDAAEAVAADDEIDAFDVLDHLGALVEKSLVVADPDRETYRLLETIRQYAAAKLAESGTADAVRARHAEHYRSWATALAPQLTGPGDLEAIDRLEGALEHLRLMLDAYRDAGRGDVVADLFTDLWQFWDREHAVEAILRLESVLAGLDGDPARLSRAHALIAFQKASVGHAGFVHNVEASAAYAAQAGIPEPILAQCALASQLAVFEGDPAGGFAQIQRAAAAAEAAGDAYQSARCRVEGLYYAAVDTRGSEGTLAYADAVRREVQQVGSGLLHLNWLNGMGMLLALGDPDRAEAPLAEAADLATRPGFEDLLATTEFLRGLVWFKQGRLGRSAVALRRGLSSYRDVGNRRGVCNVLSLVVGVALLGGSTEVAAELLSGLHRARVEFGLAQHGDEAPAERGFEALILERLGAEGRALLDMRPDSETTIDLALDTLDALAEGQDGE